MWNDKICHPSLSKLCWDSKRTNQMFLICIRATAINHLFHCKTVSALDLSHYEANKCTLYESWLPTAMKDTYWSWLFGVEKYKVCPNIQLKERRLSNSPAKFDFKNVLDLFSIFKTGQDIWTSFWYQNNQCWFLIFLSSIWKKIKDTWCIINQINHFRYRINNWHQIKTIIIFDDYLTYTNLFSLKRLSNILNMF